ncbi:MULTISPECIES: hypothetical protein [unclassified Acinetobacter]|uniref:hypothetical protein n=2 Tax=Acinetobacter TaxID=469 RepID=UPI0018AB4829|nr:MULTISPECIES: hypothetical protein [unclassified Acinetobacter]MBJ9951734.1 hypothetical protein [Acinetobacter baumannii]
MIDIVKIIDLHTFALKQSIEQASIEQRKSLVKAIFSFYEKLPLFYFYIEKNYKITINKSQLFDDIDHELLIDYQQKIQRSNAVIDEYTDDYETLDEIEVICLDAFAMMVAKQSKSQALVALFSAVIEVLDYYQNFSDQPEYWNAILEKEVLFQEQIIHDISSHIIFDSAIYTSQYQNIEFKCLDEI